MYNIKPRFVLLGVGRAQTGSNYMRNLAGNRCPIGDGLVV